MELPTVLEPQRVADDTHVITTWLPLPGLGMLPANAFLIQAREPVLVDAGVAALGEAAFDRVSSLIDPADLRWIWLTHADADHVGCLPRLLEAAPNARLVTTFLGMGKLGLSMSVSPERVYLLNPGQRLDVGDRSLRALRPPTFDAPETCALFDEKTGTLFSSDCFGAVLEQPFASAQAIEREPLRAGLALWAQIDTPWLSWIEPAHLAAALEALRGLSPVRVLSSHLPPADDMLSTLSEMLIAARRAAPFTGPDQAALAQMLTAA